jgi:hypothetical protein
MGVMQANPEQRLAALGSLAQSQFAGDDITSFTCWATLCADLPGILDDVREDVQFVVDATILIRLLYH